MMSGAQIRLYRGEWAKAIKALALRGLTDAQIEAKRHDITKAVVGRSVSSVQLTQPQLTRVIAKIKAIYDAGNLNAQITQIDREDNYKAALIERIDCLAEACGIEHGAEGLQRYFSRWFAGRAFDRLTDTELQQLAGILERRKKQLTAATTPTEDVPF